MTWGRGVRTAFAVAMVAFLLAPLLAILPLAFTSSVLLVYPMPSLSLRWFEELFFTEAWRRSIVNSLVVGFGTTALATVLGSLSALGLRGRAGLLAGSVTTIFLLPMVVPAVVLGVGMQILFARLGLTNSYTGVIVAHTVVGLPFVLVSVSGSLRGVDRNLEFAGSSLGAPPVAVFFHVTLPIALPGVLSGAVLAFATSLDEVVLTLFVAGPQQRTLARQMFSTLRENLSPAIAASSFLFVVGPIALALAALLVARRSSLTAAAE